MIRYNYGNSRRSCYSEKIEILMDDLAIQVTITGAYCAGYKGSMTEPPEPAGFEPDGYIIHSEGIRDQIKTFIDKYIDENWDQIAQEYLEPILEPDPDVLYEDWKERRDER